jgi:hypothetical protein
MHVCMSSHLVGCHHLTRSDHRDLMKQSVAPLAPEAIELLPQRAVRQSVQSQFAGLHMTFWSRLIALQGGNWMEP